jgi:hypothetical protein
MILTEVLIRSYRSFNYDFQKKIASNQSDFPDCATPWEREEFKNFNEWRPWVRVPINYPTTSIIGLNECGKSHLINAIYKCLTLKKYRPDDVCRYSLEGDLAHHGLPRIGVRWSVEKGDDEAIKQFFASIENGQEMDLRADQADESIVVIHQGTDKFDVYVESTESKNIRIYKLTSEESKRFQLLLPKPVTVERSLDLPASVDIANLYKISMEAENAPPISAFIESDENQDYFKDEDDFDNLKLSSQDRLLFRLLAQCTSFDYDALTRITGSTKAGQRNFSSQCADKAEQLLNLSPWWGQDVDARLDINFEASEVSVTLTDRTGHWYGLADRSQGMRYFLGCLFQLILATKESDRPLLILSDEPDFALSAVGQRDLLRVFRKLSEPDADTQHAQIIFSTHSAELIDPNYPSRITILRKGLYDEGTTVIDGRHNRLFEPVRSALGQRGSSLPFIDGPNLLVEGETERVFVIRMSQIFAEEGRNYIDLAETSIINADGCFGMPGIVGMAKSMPGDRAYLTVLLDNDEAARKTLEEITERDPHLVETKQIVTVDQFLESGLGKDTEIEDLVPPAIYVTALKHALVARGVTESSLPTTAEFTNAVATKPTADIAEDLVKQHTGNPKNYDKPGVMQLVFDLLDEADDDDRKIFLDRLSAMTDRLRDRIAANVLQKRHDEVRRAIRQRVQTFKHAHPVECSKSNANDLLEHMRELGNRVSAPGVLDAAVDAKIEEFGLSSGLLSDPVSNHSKFVQAAFSLAQSLTIASDERTV